MHGLGVAQLRTCPACETAAMGEPDISPQDPEQKLSSLQLDMFVGEVRKQQNAHHDQRDQQRRRSSIGDRIQRLDRSRTGGPDGVLSQHKDDRMDHIDRIGPLPQPDQRPDREQRRQRPRSGKGHQRSEQHGEHERCGEAERRIASDKAYDQERDQQCADLEHGWRHAQRRWRQAGGDLDGQHADEETQDAAKEAEIGVEIQRLLSEATTISNALPMTRTTDAT